MKRSLPLVLVLSLSILISFISCKKDSNTNTDLTVNNLSGTYAIIAATIEAGGVTINAYDSVDACERDNLYRFNTNLTLDYIDAGTQCNPPEDSTVAWYLSNDTIYTAYANGFIPTKIKSFDGHTLILTQVRDTGVYQETATSTLVKQ